MTSDDTNDKDDDTNDGDDESGIDDDILSYLLTVLAQYHSKVHLTQFNLPHPFIGLSVNNHSLVI